MWQRLKAFWSWLVDAEGDEGAQRRMVEEDARRLGGSVTWGEEGYFVPTRKPRAPTVD